MLWKRISSYFKEDNSMRKVFNYGNEMFQVTPSNFSPNQRKQPVFVAEYKISVEPEKKDLDFSQMLNAEIRALT